MRVINGKEVPKTRTKHQQATDGGTADQESHVYSVLGTMVANTISARFNSKISGHAEVCGGITFCGGVDPFQGPLRSNLDVWVSKFESPAARAHTHTRKRVMPSQQESYCWKCPCARLVGPHDTMPSTMTMTNQYYFY